MAKALVHPQLPLDFKVIVLQAHLNLIAFLSLPFPHRILLSVQETAAVPAIGK